MFKKDPDVIEGTNFNASLPVRFIIHGWLNNYKFEVNTEITAGFLHYGEYNIVS